LSLHLSWTSIAPAGGFDFSVNDVAQFASCGYRVFARTITARFVRKIPFM
jgi:hypothetical protein